MKKLKLIKVSVAILIILFIIISMTVVVLKKDLINNNEILENNENNNFVTNENKTYKNGESNGENLPSEILQPIIEDAGGIEYNYEKAEKVNNPTYFYTVQNCLESYLDSIDDLSDEDDENDEQNKEEIVLNQLDKNYIQENNISMSKLKELYNEYSFITITQMIQYLVKENNVIRFVAHVMFANQNKEVKYLNYIIYFDFKNLTYSIKPIEKSISNIDSLNLNQVIDSVEKNDNNQYKYEIVTTEKLMKKYLKSFSQMCLKAPSEAYNYLSEDYKKEKFANIDLFKSYVDENKNKIKNINLNNYVESNNNGKKKCACYDTQNNCYIINYDDVIMNFDIELDANV